VLPPALAFLLAHDEAERLVERVDAGAEDISALRARLSKLRAHGVVLPSGIVAASLAQRLERALGHLPDEAVTALAVLDLADAAGAVLDLTPSQVVLARWWEAARPAPTPGLRALRERLALAPLDEAAAPPDR